MGGGRNMDGKSQEAGRLLPRNLDIWREILAVGRKLNFFVAYVKVI